LFCGQRSIVEFAAPVTLHPVVLHIEQRGEIAAIDRETRRAPQHRLGPVGNAQAGATRDKRRDPCQA